MQALKSFYLHNSVPEDC